MNGLRIAENLVRLRHDRNVTQKELADFMGVTKASVSKWESGRTVPDVLLLPQIASFFGVTLDELVGYEETLSREQIQKIYLNHAMLAGTQEACMAVLQEADTFCDHICF